MLGKWGLVPYISSPQPEAFPLGHRHSQHREGGGGEQTRRRSFYLASGTVNIGGGRRGGEGRSGGGLSTWLLGQST